MLSCIQAVAHRIQSETKETSFVDQCMKKMTRVVDQSYQTERRDIMKITSVQKDISDQGAVLLETDKTGKIGVLPQSVFDEKVQLSI